MYTSTTHVPLRMYDTFSHFDCAVLCILSNTTKWRTIGTPEIQAHGCCHGNSKQLSSFITSDAVTTSTSTDTSSVQVSSYAMLQS